MDNTSSDKSPLENGSSNSGGNPQPPGYNLLLPALLTAMALCLIVVFVLILKSVDPQPGLPGNGTRNSKPLSAEELAKLLDQRDRAIALLENQDFPQADAAFTEIVRQVPDDPFGWRNLTICRELAIGEIDPKADPSLIAESVLRAREALERLAKVEPNSHVPHVLDARISIRAGELDKAESSLKRASELAPRSAAVWYDLFSLKPLPQPNGPDELPPAEAVATLRKVAELQPDNLFVLKDWLPLLAQNRDPSFVETATQAKATLAPFADIIKTHSRTDVLQLLDVVAKAAQNEDWSLASARTMAIRNIMVAEAARDDRYVKLDSLEYMLQDFGPAFYERNNVASASVGEAIPVKFVATPLEHPPAASTGVRDFVLIDLDLDGRLDSVSLHEKGVTATIPFVIKSSGETPSSVEMNLSGDYRQIRAFDLDDDVDVLLKDRPERVAPGLLADPELIVFGPAGLKLCENRAKPDGSREIVERPLSEPLGSLRDVTDVIPVDLDLDGDLDFVMITTEGLRFWSNRSNWSFEEITSRSQLPSADFGVTAAVVCDWDRDADNDILVAGAKGLGVLDNIRHGRFRWRLLEVGFDSLASATRLRVEQLDDNGSWDVLAAGPSGLKGLLTEITAGGLVSVKGGGSFEISPEPNTDFVTLDLDNDGVRDLMTVGTETSTIFRGLSSGRFEARKTDAWPASSLRAAVGDIDRDGDEDLALTTSKGCDVFVNEGGNANGWLDVTLVAQQIKANEQNYSKRVNHAGIGSVIELKAGPRYFAQVVTGAKTHFGVGPQKKTDVMRVIWTNGVPRNLIDPAPNTHVLEEQKLVGSCPYLYTWDGEKFVFVTDLLWNSPIGLKFAENVVAPWREWEYLKINGEKLKSRNGEYLLNITEELWEAGYFDQVKLFAIDHPAGTDVYTNEKVGPATMAEHKLHTVRSPRIPIAARDTQGRDILDQVKARDGIYTKTYDRKLAQGLTTEHFLELDLGPWKGQGLGAEGQGKGEEGSDGSRRKDQSGQKDQKETGGKQSPDQATPKQTPSLAPQPSPLSPPASPVSPPRITLFLTGWVYPTSTSLNVQFSQNPEGAQPRPPALHAVDENGQWREVRPFMGFPGGKTKTIAIDLTDIFAPNSTDHRLRIVTNMEFYWDAAFFTVDEAPVEVRQTELSLIRADLHDRGGISLRRYDPGNGPESFDHQQLVPGLHWPPMAGSFTRFGDIHELLTDRDDHLVVLGCNDEMTLAFAEPSEPPPSGWVRDFVIYNVGWDKDCDTNTVYGETVEPLPFEGMTTYAHRDGESRPRDEQYVRYLKTYQTRTQSRPHFWNNIRSQTRADAVNRR